MTSLPDAARMYLALEATWKCAKEHKLGPWVIRQDNGGGKRVNAATVTGEFTDKDIGDAEKAMTGLSQPLLFMIRQGDELLDQSLADRGYGIVDPVLMYAAAIPTVATYEPHRLAAIPCIEPLAIMAEIWAEGGFSAARLEVMKRTPGPKTHLFSRLEDDNHGGCMFAACDKELVMFHALHVVPRARRIGVARNLVVKSALWGAENGATTVTTITTGENLPAQKLFTGLGMTVVGHYHYRIKSRS